MADEAVTIVQPTAAGAGETAYDVAVDIVGGKAIQRVKFDVGGDGVSTPFTDPATSAKQDALLTAVNNLLTELSQKTEPADSQHVTVDSLPAGLATAAAQASLLTAVGLLAKLSDTQPVSLASAIALDAATLAALETIQVGSSALPTGASTEATLAAIKALLPAALVSGRLDVNVGASTLPTGAATQTTLAAILAALPATLSGSGNFKVSLVEDGGAVIGVDDNGASLTVDAPVGTPVFARLSDGAAALIGQKVMASSLPVAIASDQSAFGILASGDVDHDAVNTGKVVQVGGYASPVDVPPSVVSANGDRSRIWVDRFGAQIVRRRKIRESYTASFRLAETAARLDQTFTQVANTNKQWATLYHAVSATKEVRLQYVVVYIEAWSIASQAILELRELTGATAPATGNPAITPKPRRVGGTAAEATCLYLPTTAGSETAVNSPVKSWFVDEGIMGAAGTANPLPAQGFTLYNSCFEDDEMLPPTLPVGVAGGWAVMLRTVGAPAVRLTCEMGFTEEIP